MDYYRKSTKHPQLSTLFAVKGLDGNAKLAFLASRIDAFAFTTRSRSMSEVESTTDQTESNEPLWQVQLASGQACRMTLELLDDAFQDGLITEETLIMQDGTTEWVTLRALLGLDSEAEAPSSGGAAEANGAAPHAAAVENQAVAMAPAPVAAAPVAA